MELNNFGFNKGECIHCSTAEKAVEVLKIAHKRGCAWYFSTSFMSANWETYGENMCYDFYWGITRDITDEDDYNIIKAEDFLKQHNKNINNHKPYLIW